MMIIDDIVIGVTLSAIASTIGNRVASRVLANPFEKAQMQSVEIQQSRLEQDARLHRDRLKAERDNLERQLEHRELMAEVDHAKRVDLVDHEHGYRSWPYKALPGEILKESARYHGGAINVFVHVAASHPSGGETAPGVRANVDQHILRLMRLRDWLAENYNKTSASHPVIAYFSSDAAMQLAPQDLVAKLRRFLSGEPCVFVFAEMRGPHTLVCTFELWGMVQDDNSLEARPADVSRTVSIDLSRFDDSERAEAREAALKASLAGLIDLAHLIYRLDQRPMPVAQRVLGGGASIDLPNLSEPCTRYLEAAAAADPVEAARLSAEICRQLIDEGCTNSAESALATSTKILAGALRPGWTPMDWRDLSGLPSPGPADAAELIRLLFELRWKLTGEGPDPATKSFRLSVTEIAKRLGERNT